MIRWEDYKKNISSAPRTKAATIYRDVDQMFADKNIALPVIKRPTPEVPIPLMDRVKGFLPSLGGTAQQSVLPEVSTTKPVTGYNRTTAAPRTGAADFRRLESSLSAQEADKRRKEEEAKRKKEAEARLKELEKRQRELVKSQGMKSPANYDPAVRVEVKRNADEMAALQAQTRPGAQAFVEGVALNLTRDAVDSISGPKARAAREQARETTAYKVMNVAGNLVTQASLYGAANAAVKALGVGSKAAGGGALKAFAGAQGIDLLLDTMIQTPQEIFRAVREDKTLSETAKEIGVNRLIDVGINLAIGGVANSKQIKEFFRSLPQKQVAESVGRVAKQNNLEPSVVKQAVQTELPIAPVRQAVDQAAPARNISMPEVRQGSGASISIDLPPPQRASYPIDGPDPTLNKVMVRKPKQPAKTAVQKGQEAYERTYQAVISKYAPVERISDDLKVMSSNMNRVSGTVEYMLSKGQVDAQGNTVGESLQQIFDRLPESTRKDFYHYAYHKHNIDRAPLGKGVFGEGIDDAFSAAKVAEYEANNPEFSTIQKEVNFYTRNLLDWAVDTGLLTKDKAGQFLDMYPNYVPTYRYKDFGQDYQLLKQATGSEKDILPLDLQLVALTDKYIRKGRKNQLLNEVALEYTAGNPAAKKHILGLRPADAEPLEDFLRVGEGVAEAVKDGDGYAIRLFVDGEPWQMIVDRQMHDALKAFDSDNFVMNAAKMVNQYATKPFKSLITEYNPLFTISNIARDIPTALVFSKDPVGLVKSVPEAMKQIFTDGDIYKMYQAVGGSRSGFLGAMKKEGIAAAADQGTGSTIKRAVTAIPRGISKINNFTETLPRFAEFLSTYKSTNDPFLAAYRAAELTTDFSRHGEAGKFADAFIPYLNPAIQGGNRFIRAIRTDPLGTAAKGGLVLTLPTAILDAINHDNPTYQNLTDRERNLYYNIPIPGSDKFIRLPKSRELGVVFSSIYDWVARSARGERVTPDEIANAIEENFKVQGLENAIWEPAAKAWRQTKDPDAYETNYFGGLIVPESMRRYSPALQYNESTTYTAKKVGEQFGISPMVVDYLMDSYLGVVHDVNKAVFTDTGQGVGNILSSRFINDPAFRNKNMEEFYSLLDDVSKKAQDYNLINDVPSKEVTELEAIRNGMQKRSQALSDMRKVLRAVQANKDMSKDERLKAIREINVKMNLLAEDTLVKAREQLARIEKQGQAPN